jgi:hypothetical protein
MRTSKSKRSSRYALWRALAGDAPFGAQDERVKELCRWLLFAAVGLISDPGSDQDTLRFAVLTGERQLEAKLTAGLDDSGKLVATIMLPGED